MQHTCGCMVDFNVMLCKMVLKGGGHTQPSGFAMFLMDDRAVITELLQHEGAFQKQSPKEMPNGTDFLVVLLIIFCSCSEKQQLSYFLVAAVLVSSPVLCTMGSRDWVVQYFEEESSRHCELCQFPRLKKTQVDMKLDMHPQGRCFWLTNKIACLCICCHLRLLPVWFWHVPCCIVQSISGKGAACLRGKVWMIPAGICFWKGAVSSPPLSDRLLTKGILLVTVNTVDPLCVHWISVCLQCI